jgi:hypothetical protein
MVTKEACESCGSRHIVFNGKTTRANKNTAVKNVDVIELLEQGNGIGTRERKKF